VDATPRGGEPGTLYTLELDPDAPLGPVPPVGGHGVDLPAVFQLVRLLGGVLPPLYLVGCEPAKLGPDYEGAVGLSGPVAAAVGRALDRVEALAAELLAGTGRA
jgi:hydrogenase maturation protease